MLTVITGDGKGKTTSAAGQILRYIGSGKKACFVQFFKKGDSSEVRVLKGLGVRVLADKRSELPVDLNDSEVIRRQTDMLERLLELKNDYEVFVLDEFNLLASSKKSDPKYLKDVLKKLLESADVIATGRNAPRWLIRMADTVSKVVNVKHHYEKGIEAEKGREY